jgi:hypothetical protein
MGSRLAAVDVIEGSGSCDTGPMISIELARKLRGAGLEWLPTEGDSFMIPDRDLEEHVFTISEMTVEVHRRAAGKRISFNGAVEWALDSIMHTEVVWLPSETQLRDRLGRSFEMLRQTDEGYECKILVAGQPRVFVSDEPTNSYAQALLSLLIEPEAMLRMLVDDD